MMMFDREHTSKLQPPAPANEPFTPPEVRGVCKCVYAVLAGLLVILAAIGAFVPLLPTTPFLLLASYFLIRISPRLNRRLLQTRLFGPLLRDWQAHHAIRRNVRRRSVIAVTIVLIASYLAIQPSALGTLAFAACGAIGIVVILRLPILENAAGCSPTDQMTVAQHPKNSQPARYSSGDNGPRKCAR